MGKLSLTWEMMKASWELLKKDKEMLLYPLFSGICCLLLIAAFALPLINNQEYRALLEGHGSINYTKYFIIIFLFYFLNYLIIIFFNSAIVASAVIRLRGGNPTLGDGLNAALARLPLIIGWALVSATVGMLLKIIEDRSQSVGRWVAGFIGLAWSVITFLVIPVLVVERIGPIAALKESARLMKKTWGEQLIGRFSFGFIFFLLSLPVILLFALGSSTATSGINFFLIGIAVVYIIILALVQSTLQAIFQTIVYAYASTGKAPEGFNTELLKNAFGQKRGKLDITGSI